MKSFSLIFSVIFLLLTIPVSADDTNEGRITEHNVVSVVAFSGLLLLVYLARKYRSLGNVETENL